MKDKKDKKGKKDGNNSPRMTGLGRRDLMKMGVGAGVAAMTGMLHAPKASAQEANRPFVPPPVASGGSKGVPGGPPYTSGHTWTRRVSKYSDFKNTSGRAFGNGPMDATSRKIVEYASA